MRSGDETRTRYMLKWFFGLLFSSGAEQGVCQQLQGAKSEDPEEQGAEKNGPEDEDSERSHGRPLRAQTNFPPTVQLLYSMYKKIKGQVACSSDLKT